MTAELLKKCKIKAREELSNGREIIFVDLHSFDIVQTSPRYAVFERTDNFFRIIGGSNGEDAAKAVYNTAVDAHRTRSKRH